MSYTNNINYYTIDYLDLFDDIPFKYVKSIVTFFNKNEDEWFDFDFEVEIEDVECDRVAWCATKFTFDLKINVSEGAMPLWVTKTFVVVKEYNGSSAMAMYIGEHLFNEEEETDEDEDEDEDEETDEEEDIVSIVDLVI